MTGTNFQERKTFNGINRDTWYCGVKQPRLRKAIDAKIEFHKTRIKYWESEREKARKKFEKKGMRLVANPQFGTTAASVVSSASYSSNKVQTAEIDYELQQRWQACNAKVEQHKAKVREYAKWASFFRPSNCDNNDSEAILDLLFADMEYFGLLGDDTTDMGDK